MARKKSDQTNKLTGWKEQATGSAQTEPPAAAPDEAEATDPKQSGYHVGRFVRKTYTIPQTTIDRLAAIADKHGIGKSELARYLLDEILTQVESGDHKLPLKRRYTLE